MKAMEVIELEKEKKRGGCLKNVLIGFIILVILGSCAALLGDDESDTETTGHSEEDQAEIDRQQKEHDEKEAAKEEEEAQEEEPTEESDDVDVVEEENEEETETADKEESEEETKEDKIKHEVIDGVDVFTYTNISVISFKNQLSNFSIEMTDLLVDQHDQIDNGAVFRTISTIEDNKGNQETVYTAQVYYTQDTIDEINYDNWPRLVGEDLYNAADSVMIHHLLRDQTDIENKPYDDAPDFYTFTIGTEYEE